MKSTITNALKEAFAHEEEIFICSCCDGEFPIEEVMYVGEEPICGDCYDENTVVCSHCGDAIWSDSNAGNDSISLCQRCYDNHYVTCEHCGCIISNDDACYDDDDDYSYCQSCYNRYGIGTIHEYSYKPYPIFYGTGPQYFGVELEIDGAGKDGANAHEILTVANQADEHIYIKSDSSLNDGMEIVTHPCSLDYHIKHLPWRDIVQKALELSYKSHKTSTCGLHIHVSRNAFSDDYQVQEDCIGRILFFMERHWEELLKFSRRTESQLNRWACRYGFKNTPKDILDHAKKGYSGRYTCLNLNNSDTIEFRIFRGTLKYNTLIATLQLVNEICNVAFSMSDEQLSALCWTSFAEHITAKELISYLKERRIYINEPFESEEND